MARSGRLNDELLGRVVAFGARVLCASDVLGEQQLSRRVIDQLIGSGCGKRTAFAALLFCCFAALPEHHRCGGHRCASASAQGSLAHAFEDADEDVDVVF